MMDLKKSLIYLWIRYFLFAQMFLLTAAITYGIEDIRFFYSWLAVIVPGTVFHFLSLNNFLTAINIHHNHVTKQNRRFIIFLSSFRWILFIVPIILAIAYSDDFRLEILIPGIIAYPFLAFPLWIAGTKTIIFFNPNQKRTKKIK
jgi:hypothetical protein